MRMFMQALLNIEDYFLEEILIKTNPDFNIEKNIEGELFIDFDIFKNDKNPLLFKIVMNIESNKKLDNYPYYIIIKLNGIFSYPKEVDEEYVQKTISYNAPSILYGIARGIISQITGNYNYGKFILPSINIIEILKEKKKKFKFNNNIKK